MLGSAYRSQVTDSILGVEFGVDLVTQAGLSLIKTAGLNDDDAGHDVQLGVQAGATGAAEVVAVVFARLSLDVIEFGFAWWAKQNRPLAGFLGVS